MCKRSRNECDYGSKANSKQTRHEEIQDADIDPPLKRTKLENPCAKDKKEDIDEILYALNKDTDSEDNIEDEESFTDTESLFDDFDSLVSFSSLLLFFSDNDYEDFFFSSSDSEDSGDDHDGDMKNGKKEQYDIVSGK